MSQQDSKASAPNGTLASTPVCNGESFNRDELLAHTEFVWEAIKTTADLSMKAIAFYFAIMAAILGFVFSHPLVPSLRTTALSIVFIVTTLFCVSVGSVSWGLLTGLKDLESSQERLLPFGFAELDLHQFYSRARVVFWVVAIASLIILGTLLTGIAIALLM